MSTASLTCKNVWTTVEAGDEVYRLLDKKLKTWVKGAERRWEYRAKKWDGYEHNFTANHKFRTGLVDYVKQLLEREGHTVVVSDERDRPPTDLHDIDLVDLTPRDYQLDAVDAAIKYGRGVIQHGTGGGKTETMALIAQRLGLPALMLVDQQHLASQTRDRWNFRLGREDVGLYGAGVKVDGDIVCATFQTIRARMKANPDKTLDWLAKFDVLFIDECHHLVASTYQSIVDKVPAFYRFGFSATPFKSKGLKDASKNDDPAALLHVVGTCGPLLHEFRAGDLAEGGYVVRANIEMKNWRKPRLDPRWDWEREDFDLDDDHYDYTGRKAKKGRAAVPGLYRVAIIENKARNEAVVVEALKLVTRGWPVLVFVDKVEHGRELYTAFRMAWDDPELVAMLRAEGWEYERAVEFIHGKHDVEERDKHLKALGEHRLPVLIASTVLDEGVDIPARVALVFAGGGKAQHRYIQRIGRGQRLAASKAVVEVRDFFDTHSKTMWLHSKKRQSAYESDPAGYTVRVT